MFEISFLRHPEVDYPPGRCYGRLDVALAPGWRQWAETRAETLRLQSTTLASTVVWSSPAGRCADAARVIAHHLGTGLCLDPRLLELDFGEWEGQSWDAIDRAALDRWAADPPGFRPPGGESGADLVARVASFAAALREKAQPCIVISHGGPLRLLPALLRDEPVDLLAASPGIGSLMRMIVG